MNYGLYLSASGSLTSLARMDVLSNNLANAQTAGFRPSKFSAMHRLPERLEDPEVAAAVRADPQLLLEQLGGGVLSAPVRLDDRQGPIETTGNALDLAVHGDGYFSVRALEGRSAVTRFTRDGRFVREASGRLVTATGGHPVLDRQGKPINLPGSGPVQVDREGRVVQDGAVVAQFGLSGFDADDLIPTEGGLLAPAANVSARAAGGEIISGAIEGSGVDPVVALTEMMETSRTLTANTKLMQFHDQLMNQAINRLGRVA
jgi:flagellar basal-body rod protein FlgF